MQYLVTGGTGFIGSHIVKLLASENHDVDVLVRKMSSTELIDGARFQSVVGDLTDKESLRGAISNEVDVIFHNAAIMADWGDKQHFYPVNVEGTQNVLEVMREKDIPSLVFTSSTAVYGFPNAPEPISEDAPKKPMNTYQKSKLAAENLIWEFRDEYGMKATAVRPPVVVGRGDMFTGPQIIQRLEEGKMYTFGGGTNTQSFAHGEDVARCLILAGKKISTADGNPFNVTSFTVQFVEFLDALRKELGTDKPLKSVPYKVAVGIGSLAGGLYRAFRRPKAPVITSFRVKMFGTEYIIDDQKARKELGYNPKWDLESAAKDMVDWRGTVKPR